MLKSYLFDISASRGAQVVVPIVRSIVISSTFFVCFVAFAFEKNGGPLVF